MATVILKVKEDKTFPCPDAYIVKNGRKVFAKIYGPNEWHSGWNVEFGCVGATDLRSKQEALSVVQRNAQAGLDMRGIEGSIEVVCEG